ncbi:MAG: hypothetical protein RLZZ546_2914 [Bacteroidota bacterium]|jgi:predicted nucleic acid-binding protein
MKVFIDANVLYPQTLREFILQIARLKLIEVFWSQEVLDEWYFNIQKKLTPKEKNRLKDTIQLLHHDFPHALVKDFTMIENANLIDQNDIHVISAAIHAKVDVILTFNTRDFPKSMLRKYGMTHFHPDKFVQHLLTKNKLDIIQAFEQLMKTSDYEKRSENEVIKLISNRGLVKSMRLFCQIKNTL